MYKKEVNEPAKADGASQSIPSAGRNLGSNQAEQTTDWELVMNHPNCIKLGSFANIAEMEQS